MIPNQIDLSILSKAIYDNMNSPDLSNMEIIFYVNKDELIKVNEDFYIRNYGTTPIDNDINEVDVNVYNLKFKYKLKDE